MLEIVEIGMFAIPEPILSVFQVYASDAASVTFLICTSKELKLVKCERFKKGRKNIWHTAAKPF